MYDTIYAFLQNVKNIFYCISYQVANGILAVAE